MFFDSVSFKEVNKLEVFKDKEGKSEMSSFRTASGGHFIAFSLGNELSLFELVLSKSATSSTDFSNIRYIL